jgi:hypothetical protein
MTKKFISDATWDGKGAIDTHHETRVHLYGFVGADAHQGVGIECSVYDQGEDAPPSTVTVTLSIAHARAYAAHILAACDLEEKETPLELSPGELGTLRHIAWALGKGESYSVHAPTFERLQLSGAIGENTKGGTVITPRGRVTLDAT